MPSLFGSKTQSDTNSTSTNTSSSMQTQTPQNAAFMNSLYPQINNLIAKSQQPVYGQAQQAQFQNSVNQGANSAMNGLAAQLAARTGSVNSGAFATGAQNLLSQKAGAMSNYAMQVPMLNYQNSMQSGLQALSLGNQIAGPALRGNTGGSQSSGTQDTTTTQSEGIGSILSGLAGGVLGATTGGLSGLAGSLFGSPSAASMNNLPAGGGYGGLNYGPSSSFAPPSISGNPFGDSGFYGDAGNPWS